MEKKKTQLFCKVYGKHLLEKLEKELNLNVLVTFELNFDFTFDGKIFTMNLRNLTAQKENFSEELAIYFRDMSDIIIIVFDLKDKEEFDRLKSSEFGKFLERHYKNSFKVFILYTDQNDWSGLSEEANDAINFAKEHKGIYKLMEKDCFKCFNEIIKEYLINKYNKKIEFLDTRDEKIKCHFNYAGKHKKKTDEYYYFKIKKLKFCLIY